MNTANKSDQISGIPFTLETNLETACTYRKMQQELGGKTRRG